jgi:two-component system, LuxR family, sensor kinase FixL
MSEPRYMMGFPHLFPPKSVPPAPKLSQSPGSALKHKLASGLSHELNQPLTAATNYLQAARRFLEGGDATLLQRAKGAVESATTQVRRTSEIIRGLRELVKKSDPERRPENVVTLTEVANGLALINAKERGVTVRFRAAANLPPVLVDKIQIQQVLVNIVRNAVEAMEASVRRELTIEATAAGDGFAAIAVADTGPGIAAEVAERLFKPFVTTKTDGMGVGLSLCRAIVEAHGGMLDTATNSDGGATFRFTVPVASA